MPNIKNYKLLHQRFINFTKIVSDWDETITNKDTIPLVFNTIPASCPYKLDHFFNTYMKAYNDYYQNELPLKSYKDRRLVENEIKLQKDLKKIERSSLEEAERLLVFKDVTIKDFHSQVNNIQIKPGFESFFKFITQYTNAVDTKHEQHVEFVVLSVNWTSLIIKEYFNTQLGQSSMDVKTNEFEFDLEGKCTGKISDVNGIDIRTGYDKLQQCKYIETNALEPILYIGDSVTDVLSMIYCKLSIIMKGGKAGSKLREMGYRVYDINECIPEEEVQQVKFLEVDNWFDLLYVWNPNLYKL